MSWIMLRKRVHVTYLGGEECNITKLGEEECTYSCTWAKKIVKVTLFAEKEGKYHIACCGNV